MYRAILTNLSFIRTSFKGKVFGVISVKVILFSKSDALNNFISFLHIQIAVVTFELRIWILKRIESFTSGARIKKYIQISCNSYNLFIELFKNSMRYFTLKTFAFPFLFIDNIFRRTFYRIRSL